jgi:DNA-nicking Smr family endonuclease
MVSFKLKFCLTILEIDLHGKISTVAINIVNETIKKLCEQRSNKTVKFIVGIGNHSTNGKPVLKPLIFNYIRKRYDSRDLLCWVPDENPGEIRIRLILH